MDEERMKQEGRSEHDDHHQKRHHPVRHHKRSFDRAPPTARGNTGLKVVAVILVLVAISALAYYVLGPSELTTATTGSNANAAGTVSQEILEFNKKLADDDPVKGDANAPVTIVEFSDFQCPYCAKFYKETLSQIEEQYIKTGKAKLVYRDFPLSFHPFAQKASEAAECAKEQGIFWEMHNMLFDNQQKLDIDSLKKYAANLKLNTATFNTCLDSGKYAAEVQKDLTDGQSQGISGTPGFVINGKVVSGAQPFSVFKNAIDKALSGNTNQPAVDLVVVTDKNCADCDTSQIIGALQQLFTGIKSREIDVSSAEGKEAIEKYGLEKVPSYLLSANVVDADGFIENPNLAQVFVKASDKYKIIDEATGATRFIDATKQAEYEKRLAEQKKAQQEKLGIVANDNKPQIDFFIMSYCPYGNQAEEGIEGAFQILQDKAVFKPRFIFYENYGGGGSKYCIDSDNKYCSMHGVQEANQDIRELCVYNDQGQAAFFKFALAMNQKCSAQNADSCWESVAKDLGFDTAKIKACEASNAETYGGQELELTGLLGVQGSPTVYIDGEPYNGGRAASDYLAAICEKFDTKPEECKNIVAAPTQAATVSGQC